MTTIRTTKLDFKDTFTFECKADDSSVINLAGATVKLYVGRFGGTTLVDGATMTITDAPNGIVTYFFAENALSTSRYYDAQIEINFSGGGHKRLKPFTLDVMPQL